MVQTRQTSLKRGAGFCVSCSLNMLQISLKSVRLFQETCQATQTTRVARALGNGVGRSFHQYAFAFLAYIPLLGSFCVECARSHGHTWSTGASWFMSLPSLAGL